MNHLRIGLFALLALLLSETAVPLKKAENPDLAVGLTTIDSDDIFVYIDYLASDALYGRNAGTAGNERAVKWIAERFQQLGLKPAGDNGTFLQKFSFKPRGTSEGKAEASNVVALLPGSDPRLSEEVIVIGAHLDHVGRKGHDSDPGRIGQPREGDGIWNGADDNASGTAAVLEIAQAFAFSRRKPLRSILFILFNAEEHGLYGSRHYVKNPVVPLEQTVAMINLDMVGRNANRPVQVISAASARDNVLKDLTRACAWAAPDISLEFDKTAFSGSDHAPFLAEKVPVAFFFTGLHRDYHHVTDEADKIDCGHVAGISRVVFLLVHELASRDERITFDPEFKPPASGAPPRKLLGVDLGKRVPHEDLEGLGLDSDQGALLVKRVRKNTPAASAGIEKGDLILALGAIRIRENEPATSLREAIQAAPEGADVPLEIVRDGSIRVIAVRFPVPE